MKSVLRITFVALICLTSLFDAVAQAENNPLWAKYAIHTDLGVIGYGGVFTVNFEARVWTNNKAFQLFIRTGYGLAGTGSTGGSTTYYGVPLNLTALFGKKMHYFEFTAGGIVSYRKDVTPDTVSGGVGIWPLVDIGYRFQYQPKGIILRVKIGTGGIGGGIGIGF